MYKSLGVELSYGKNSWKMSEDLNIVVADYEAAPIPVFEDRCEGQSFTGYEIISTAKELLAAEGKDQVEEVALYLEELKVCEREEGDVVGCYLCVEQ